MLLGRVTDGPRARVMDTRSVLPDLPAGSAAVVGLQVQGHRGHGREGTSGTPSPFLVSQAELGLGPLQRDWSSGHPFFPRHSSENVTKMPGTVGWLVMLSQAGSIHRFPV